MQIVLIATDSAVLHPLNLLLKSGTIDAGFLIDEYAVESRLF